MERSSGKINEDKIFLFAKKCVLSGFLVVFALFASYVLCVFSSGL